MPVTVETQAASAHTVDREVSSLNLNRDELFGLSTAFRTLREWGPTQATFEASKAFFLAARRERRLLPQGWNAFGLRVDSHGGHFLEFLERVEAALRAVDLRLDYATADLNDVMWELTLEARPEAMEFESDESVQVLRDELGGF